MSSMEPREASPDSNSPEPMMEKPPLVPVSSIIPESEVIPLDVPESASRGSFMKYSEYFPRVSVANERDSGEEDDDMSHLFDDTQSNLSSVMDDVESTQSANHSSISSSVEDEELFALKFRRFVDDDAVSTVSSNDSHGTPVPTPPPNAARSRASTSLSPPRHRPPPPPRRTGSMSPLNGRSTSAQAVSSLFAGLGLKALSVSRHNVLSKLNKSRSKKDIVGKLDAAVLSVEDALKEKVRRLMHLQDEVSVVESMMEKEISKWETIACWDVANAGRSYFQNRVLYLESEVEMARLHCKCFSNKFKELRKVSCRVRKHQDDYERDDLIFSVEAAISTASNIRLPKAIHRLRVSADTLKTVVHELKGKYDEEKESLKREMTTTERQQHMITILVQVCESSTMFDDLYFHPLDSCNLQMSFEQMLFDARFEEGKILHKWTKVMSESSHKATCKGVASFAKKLTSKLCNSCDLLPGSEFYNEMFPQTVYLMVHRTILPRISDVMAALIDADEESFENDSIYSRRLSWMVSLSQSELHVEEPYCHEDEARAYGVAVNHLRRINFTWVPHEIVMHAITAVRAVQECAEELKKEGEHGINGDVLFPIVVYCVVQSGITKWHRLFAMFEFFLPPNVLERGQSGYCLSLLRAAVGFVMQQRPSNFGLDDDFETVV